MSTENLELPKLTSKNATCLLDTVFTSSLAKLVQNFYGLLRCLKEESNERKSKWSHAVLLNQSSKPHLVSLNDEPCLQQIEGKRRLCWKMSLLSRNEIWLAAEQKFLQNKKCFYWIIWMSVVISRSLSKIVLIISLLMLFYTMARSW